MLHQLANDVKDTARATARAALFSTLGGIFALVGTGFLTVALWLLLVTLESAIFAASVIGALYCAFGFILMAVGLKGKAQPSGRYEFSSGRTGDADAANAPREPFLQVAEGFAMGLKAGRSARSR
ncbi:phage holin family protein [uncultured Roseovarius sp.]|uniref:phage holin family protein n=1 Tax=uncultured Roseovarius sp. TaxID=293344 RepID=UPI00262CB5C0|nr:phage holin family protein [uncultured Roseovarius sp.]